MNIASHILYTLPVFILSNKMCGNNNNGIGGHQKINIYHTKTIYRKPRKQNSQKWNNK